MFVDWLLVCLNSWTPPFVTWVIMNVTWKMRKSEVWRMFRDVQRLFVRSKDSIMFIESKAVQRMLYKCLSHQKRTVGWIAKWMFCWIAACPTGRFGVNCIHECHCSDAQEACHALNGTCASGCNPRYKGADCQGRCMSLYEQCIFEHVWLVCDVVQYCAMVCNSVR